MPYLIDGHNLIPKLPGLSLADVDDEERLLTLLQTYARLRQRKIEVYFDNAPPGQPRRHSYGLVTACFVPQGRSADEAFLGIDAATDVLAFPLGETDPQSGALYLGDVILSWPRAQAQAAAAGHSSLAELQLLAVHGILHLLGYDHITDDEKARMWQLQRDILADLGLAEIAPR